MNSMQIAVATQFSSTVKMALTNYNGFLNFASQTNCSTEFGYSYFWLIFRGI